MKQIPRIPLDGASILSPSEMNSIHFETGLHSPTATGAGASTSTTTVPPSTSAKK